MFRKYFLFFKLNQLTRLIQNRFKKAWQSCPQFSSCSPEERKILHSVRELAEYLEISQTTAMRYKLAGKVPFYQVKPNHRILFYSDEVLKSMKNRKGGNQ